MNARTSIPLLSLALLGGCFSPDGGANADTDGSSGSSSSASASVGDSSDTQSSGTSQSGTGSTSEATTDEPTTDEPTTDDPTDDPTDPTMGDTTSGGEDPFCGDGNVDPGEECDDGVDNNGLDQSCLPDCNLNVCGDGNLGPDEVCDDGEDDNVMEVGACAPDCSRVIEEKIIQQSSTFSGGNLQPNPVGFADGQCPPGFRALFSVNDVRQANDGTPFAADALVDWPILPYTAYTRGDGTLIWMTDDVPLLGVREGGAQPLTNEIVEPCISMPGFPCLVIGPVITGLDADWTTASSNTCNGWTSTSESDMVRRGYVDSDTEFISSPDLIDCVLDDGGIGLLNPRFYCVEQ